MSFNLQLSKSENIKAIFSAPKWLPVCNQFRLASYFHLGEAYLNDMIS